MAATVRSNGVNTFLDFNGDPLAGGLVYTYATGTSTPLPTFADAAELAPNPNPIVLDSAGRATIFWDGIYKVVVRSADGSLSETIDPLADSASQLKADLAGTATAQGASLIYYKGTYTGEVGATIEQAMSQGMVSAFRFMTQAQIIATLAGSSIDTSAAIQLAHDTGRLVDYPEGAYLVSTPIVITQGGMRGRGRLNSRIYSNDNTTADIFTYEGAGGSSQVPLFQDIGILSLNNTKPAGAGLRFSPSSGELQYATLRGLLVYQMPQGVRMNACAFGSMDHCTILNYSDAGILYENTVDPGSGDFSIDTCHIGTSMSAGLRQGARLTSGGGLRFINNKVLGGRTSFVLAYDQSTISGPMLITGNSLENALDQAIYLGSTGGSYGGIVISGNEMAQNPNGITAAPGSVGGINELMIGPNYISLSGATNGQCISLTNVTDFTIAPQLLVGNGTTTTGIGVSASCVNGKIAKQTYKRCGQTLVNQSLDVYADLDTQRGSASVTTNVAYGSLFIGQSTITFARPFTTLPFVFCEVNGGEHGGISASARIADITKTGFIMTAYGVNNGDTIPNVFWRAEGIL